MDLMQKYPRICDLKTKAEKKIPTVASSYLNSGTGLGEAKKRNEESFKKIELVPRHLRGKINPNLQTKFLGKTYDMPFGIAPIGLQSLIWPGSEKILAKTALKRNIPYCLSTVANESIEKIAEIAADNAWFQLYPPENLNVMKDLLSRAWDVGIKTLIVTVDVPTQSRREEMRIAGAPLGSRKPMAITSKIFFNCLFYPGWSLNQLLYMISEKGKLRFKNMEKYNSDFKSKEITSYIGEQLNNSLTWEYFKKIRKQWKGNLIIKGVLSVEDALKSVSYGANAILISNHGGRQIDSVPPSLEKLSEIRETLGNETSLILDSGIRSGLDIARSIAMGANFVLLGRGFMYGMAALGKHGGDHVYSILKDELENTMIQLGVENLHDLKNHLK